MTDAGAGPASARAIEQDSDAAAAEAHAAMGIGDYEAAMRVTTRALAHEARTARAAVEYRGAKEVAADDLPSLARAVGIALIANARSPDFAQATFALLETTLEQEALEVPESLRWTYDATRELSSLPPFFPRTIRRGLASHVHGDLPGDGISQIWDAEPEQKRAAARMLRRRPVLWAKYGAGIAEGGKRQVDTGKLTAVFFVIALVAMFAFLISLGFR
jgi:hypothetical protein